MKNTKLSIVIKVLLTLEVVLFVFFVWSMLLDNWVLGAITTIFLYRYFYCSLLCIIVSLFALRKKETIRIAIFLIIFSTLMMFPSIYVSTARGISYLLAPIFEPIFEQQRKSIMESQQKIVNDRQVKHYKHSISDYTKAIEINPNDVSAYRSRKRAYYMIKEYDNAWADVHKLEGLGATIEPIFLRKLKQASGRDK